MATLLSQIKGIVTAHNKSGSRVLWAAQASIDHMIQHKDWTCLAWLVSNMEPASDGALLRRIVGECVGGLTLVTKGKEASAQPSGMVIKMGDNFGPTAKMEVLRALVKDGESFRGKRVREELLERAEPTFDLHKFAARMLKKLENEGVTLADLLSEVGKVKKEQSVIDVTKPESQDAKLKAA